MWWNPRTFAAVVSLWIHQLAFVWLSGSQHHSFTVGLQHDNTYMQEVADSCSKLPLISESAVCDELRQLRLLQDLRWGGLLALSWILRTSSHSVFDEGSEWSIDRGAPNTLVSTWVESRHRECTGLVFLVIQSKSCLLCSLLSTGADAGLQELFRRLIH